MLLFQGSVWKDGAFWLAEVPMLNAVTQGRTKKQAYEMIVDLIETMVDQPGFRVVLFPGKGNVFEIGSDNTEELVALLLQRKRQFSGLTLADAAKRLEQSSRNAYARYEQGKAVPTLSKLTKLLAAVDPEHDLVLTRSNNSKS